MTMPLIAALAIIAFAAGFHLLWALGGRLGLSVSLPERAEGGIVMPHRFGWWRPAAGVIAAGLILLGLLALGAAGRLALPLPPIAMRVAVGLAGAVFIVRAIAPTPWTGFFKRIRTTRWAKYDTRLYSPLALLLGLSLLAVARG